MCLADALSQLAIFGATSIELSDGQRLPLEETLELIDRHAGRRFQLSAIGRWVGIIDLSNGQVLARAVTVWWMEGRLLLAAG
jgi:hypothetical protein